MDVHVEKRVHLRQQVHRSASTPSSKALFVIFKRKFGVPLANTSDPPAACNNNCLVWLCVTFTHRHYHRTRRATSLLRSFNVQCSRFGGLKMISRCVVPFWKSVVGGELKVIQAQKRGENIHVCNERVSSLPRILPLVFVQVVCLLLVERGVRGDGKGERGEGGGVSLFNSEKNCNISKLVFFFPPKCPYEKTIRRDVMEQWNGTNTSHRMARKRMMCFHP